MTENTQANPPTDEVAREGAIGRKVGGGMTWMTLSAVATRAATFVAQILMGWWLEPGDFALYGTATAVAGFLMVCRDMGTGYILVQRGKEEYEKNAGPAFWLGFVYNMIVLGVTCVIAYPLATKYYDARELAPMLIVMASALPFGAIANVLYNKLRLDLRFKAFSMVTTASGFVRQVAMIMCAWAGLGPMSFAWPVLVCIIVDCIILWWITRDSVWLRQPDVRQWGGWIRDAVWLMLTSLASFTMDWGPYLVLGAMLTADDPMIGYYFFAYQITAQIGVILAFNSTVVLTPALQRLNNEPRRQCDAALRALRTLMLAGSIASLGLAAIMQPLEHLLWNGKYRESVMAVVALGVLYPWRITFGLSSSVLTAQGKYRTLFVIGLIEGVGLMLAAYAAGRWWPTALGIAVCTGVWVMFCRIGVVVFMFKGMGEPRRRVLAAMFPAWLVACAGLLCAASIQYGLKLRATIEEPLSRAWGGGERGAFWVARVMDGVEIGVYGSVCAGVMLLLARWLLRPQLEDMLTIAPARIRGPLRRVLGMPANISEPESQSV
jgi:O-antigen/teichoic acid export membrane protein